MLVQAIDVSNNSHNIDYDDNDNDDDDDITYYRL